MSFAAEMCASLPAVICLSGGMDSTSLLLHLLAQNREVYGLSFDYGQKHKVELDRLRQNLTYLDSHGLKVHWDLIDVSHLARLLDSALTTEAWDVPRGHYEADNMKQTVVPNRNAIFASMAYASALSIAQRQNTSVDLCLGVHSGDHAVYPDCRPEFYEALFQAFAIGNWGSESVRCYLPYLELDKATILKDAITAIEKLELDFDTIFRNTMTCYAPTAEGQSTGQTGSDVERILAFHSLGRVDPIEYSEPWETVVQRALELEKQHQSSQKN